LKIENNIIEDLFELQGAIGIATSQTNVNSYDFNFRNYFDAKSVIRETNLEVVLRIGAISNYDLTYTELHQEGINLINSIEQHNLASLLPNWYPLISELTPRTVWFNKLPNIQEIKKEFDWPIFIKGERQTNRHKKSLCIAENEIEFENIINYWKHDPILNWQRVICREFINLEKIENAEGDKIQISNEFRVFLWKGKIVGCGNYWDSENQFVLDQFNEQLIKNLVMQVAEKIHVPFLVIDVARTQKGKWIVIELNDAQESGYAGVNKLSLWNNIILNEKQ